MQLANRIAAMKRSNSIKLHGGIQLALKQTTLLSSEVLYYLEFTASIFIRNDFNRLECASNLFCSLYNVNL